MKITKNKALILASIFGINLEVVPVKEWIFGLNVELEHGKKLGVITNISGDNLLMTAQIVIAHLIEDPRYYKFLKRMEEQRDSYWKLRKKPDIFNK